jgi:hypothetical protein
MTVANTCHPSPMVEDARTGLGLRNVRERLEILYGAGAKLVTGFTTASRFEEVIDLPAIRETQCES